MKPRHPAAHRTGRARGSRAGTFEGSDEEVDGEAGRLGGRPRRLLAGRGGGGGRSGWGPKRWLQASSVQLEVRPLLHRLPAAAAAAAASPAHQNVTSTFAEPASAPDSHGQPQAPGMTRLSASGPCDSARPAGAPSLPIRMRRPSDVPDSRPCHVCGRRRPGL